VKRSAKRLNVPVLVALLVGGGLLAIGTVALHRRQVAKNASGLARLAESKLDAGKKQEALALYARYLSYRPGDAAAQATFARLLMEFAERPEATRGDRNQAYAVLENAVRKNPDDLLLRERLIDWMLRFRRFGEAAREVAILRERIDERPADAATGTLDVAALDVMRTRALTGIGEFRAAAESAAAVIGFDVETQSFPEVAGDEAAKPAADVALEATLLLAELLESRLRSTPAARRVMDRLVVTYPQEFRAWLALGQWRQMHGDLPGAADAVREAAALAPEEPDVLFSDLELSLAEKRFDVAARLADKAHGLYPDDERSYRALATVAMSRRDIDGAVARLQEGLEHLPGQPVLQRTLADVLLQGNRIDEAAGVIGTLVKTVGDKRPAVGLLQARLLMAQRRWLAARQQLESLRPLVADSEPLTIQVDLCLGQCHEMLGQFDEQLAANRRVLLEDHTSLAARLGVANALAASGKPDAALDEVEAVAASLPADQLARLPAVWTPLLQLRIASQMRRPQEDRDWTGIDALLERLERSGRLPEIQASLLRADLLVRKGQSAAAIDLLRRNVAAHPGSAQVRAALAIQTLRDVGVEEARAVLDAAPGEGADDPLLLSIRAQLAARLPAGEAAASLASLEEKASSLPPDQAVRLLSLLGSMRRGLGDLAAAERLNRAALERSPDDIGPLMSLFDLAVERADLATARTRAGDISRLTGPTSPESRVAAATVLILDVQMARSQRTAEAADGPASEPSPLEQDQLVTARNLLIEAENVRPGWQRIQQCFADVARLQGDTAAAIERLQKAARMGTPNPALVRSLVSLLFMSDRLEEAREALALVGPDGLDGLDGLARLSAELDARAGQFDRAVAAAERSVAGVEGDSAADLLWLGQLLARAGRHERARDVLERAVDADPGRAEGWMALFLSQLAAAGRPAAERTLARGAEALADPRRTLFLAQASEMLGRIDEAESHFHAAQVAAPDDPSVTRSLAAFLVRQGRLTAARRELDTLIAAPGEDPTTRRARVWARRTLAQSVAAGGSYRSLQEALGLLRDNAADERRASAEDIALELSFLAARSEPASWRRALDAADRLAAIQPLTTDQRIQKAVLLERLGRWGESRDQLLSIAAMPNAPPTFHALLIEKLIDHGDLPGADIWLKTLAERFPAAPIVSGLEARLALARNDRPTAVAAARRLMPPADPRATTATQLATLAELLERLGFASAADEVFAKYAAISTDGVLARAGFLGRAQRTTEALDLLDASRDSISLETLLRSAVGVLTASHAPPTDEDTARVAAWFDRARRQDPGSANVELLFAECMGATGRHEAVVSTLRGLLARTDLTPLQRAIAANNLAFHLAGPDTAAEAERLVAEAEAELGPHSDLLDTRGLVMLAAGRSREAVADLRESVLVPSATKYLHLAAALVAERDPDGAREALNRGRTLGLDSAPLSVDDRDRLRSIEASLAR